MQRQYSGQRLKKERPAQHPLIKSNSTHAIILIQLCFWCLVGTSVRYYIDQLLVTGCIISGATTFTLLGQTNEVRTNKQYIARGPCIWNEALPVFKDIYNNILGSFILGCLTNFGDRTFFERQIQERTNNKLLKGLNLMFLVLSCNNELLVGLRTGFCGSVTTYSGWQISAIMSLTATQIDVVNFLAKIILGVLVALSAFQFGKEFFKLIMQLTVFLCTGQTYQEKEPQQQLSAKQTSYNKLEQQGSDIQSSNITNNQQTQQSIKDVEASAQQNIQQVQLKSRNNANNKNSFNYDLRQDTQKINSNSDKEQNQMSKQESIDITQAEEYLRQQRQDIQEEKQEIQQTLQLPSWQLLFVSEQKHQQYTKLKLSKFEYRFLMAAEVFIFTATFIIFIVWYALVLWRVGVTVFASPIFGAFFFAPFGCILRYELSRLNFCGPPFIRWFPSGTFMANVLGSLISYVLTVILQLKDVSQQSKFMELVEDIENGYTGALSTVSTWVQEIQLMREEKKVGQAYLYMSITIGTTITLGIIIMGIPLWVLYR